MDEFTELVDLARSVPMLDVLELCGLEPPNSQGHIPSIFHEENTPSLHIAGGGPASENMWHDFSSGRGGDSIAFVQAYMGCSFGRAVRFLAGQADPSAVRRLDARQREPERIPNLRDHFHEAGANWSITSPGGEVAAVQTRKRWGLELAWILRNFMVRIVGTAPELWAGHVAYSLPNSPVTGIKIRSLIPGEKRKWSVPSSKYVELYQAPRQSVEAPAAVAWLVEGESDTWCMHHALHGVDQHVYGLPSGAGMWRPEWEQQLSRYKRVLIALDDDKAGHDAAEAIVTRLPHGEIVPVPEGRVAESLMKGWKP